MEKYRIHFEDCFDKMFAPINCGINNISLDLSNFFPLIFFFLLLLHRSHVVAQAGLELNVEHRLT